MTKGGPGREGSSLPGLTGGFPKGQKDQNKVNSVLEPNMNVPAWVPRKKPLETSV